MSNSKKNNPTHKAQKIAIRRTTSSDDSSSSVLDLRSIVAKQELEQRRKEREQKKKEIQHRLKEVQAQQQAKKTLAAISTPQDSTQDAKKFFRKNTHAPRKPVVKFSPTPEPASKEEYADALLYSFEQVERIAEQPSLRIEPQPTKRPSKKTPVLSAKEPSRESFFFVAKSVAAFVFFAILAVLPAHVYATLNQSESLQDTLVRMTEEAVVYLQDAGSQIQQLDFGRAEVSFSQAVDSFQNAQKRIEEVNALVLSLAPYVPVKGKEFTSGQQLLLAGEELSAAGEQLSKGLNVFTSTNIQEVVSQENAGLTSLLVVAHSALYPAVQHVSAASYALQEISLEAIPQEKRELVQRAQEIVPAIESALQESLNMSEFLLAFLGHGEDKRYLVLFQNNHELRPTGGFIGSLALVEVSHGSIKSVNVPAGGSYDIAGQLTERTIAPDPLHLVNPHWNLPDANWFPHYPASAHKIEALLKASGGPEVDGVIALVPGVVESLLDVTGPIDLTEQFGVVIDKENFYTEVQERAEEKYDVTTESKKIISEMTPLLLERLFQAAEDPQGVIRIVNVLRTALLEKNLLVFMNDPLLQTYLSQQDWSGELKQTDRDYLGIFHANIAGGKTDDVIEQAVTHHADIQADGSIIDTVTLTRVHKGSADDPFRGVDNTDFVRFYVPQDSQLIDVHGFKSPAEDLFLSPESGYVIDPYLKEVSGEISLDNDSGVWSNTEFGKSVFGGWMHTPVGGSSQVILQYRLPFRIDVDGEWSHIDRYSLLVQKQPGSFGDYFMSELTLPEHMRSIRSLPQNYSGEIRTMLNEDLFVGLVLERREN